MKSRPVAFIALEEYDNLGVGYLAALLSVAGYQTRSFDFRTGKENILGKLRELNPFIVGFSVIFEDYIDIFAEMIRFFRKEGIGCHFVAGGFYASLREKEIFNILPSLDSVVRFEGEYTLLELADSLSEGKEWRNLKGIAFKEGDEVRINPLRSPQKDLDVFPFPLRAQLKEYALDKKFATLIAGRGCTHNCNFCNIREFYKRSSGPVKRIRRTENVVDEMEFLYQKEGCSVFLFNDDDFPSAKGQGKKWAESFCREIRNRKLDKYILWKINCRPDDIEYDTFNMMKSHGLFLVFVGIEDGTNHGLQVLNKNMTVEGCLRGINILKDLSLGFDYGFMLFQPSSTFSSINQNLDFLEKICGDGYTPLSFLKLQPYFETQVEISLRRQGRLKGRPGSLDYDFLENSLNEYYVFITDCLREWLRSKKGLLNIMRWARNYLMVYSRLYGDTPEFSEISGNVKTITSKCNLFLLGILKELAISFETGKYNNADLSLPGEYRKKIVSIHEECRRRINKQMAYLLRIAGKIN